MTVYVYNQNQEATTTAEPKRPRLCSIDSEGWGRRNGPKWRGSVIYEHGRETKPGNKRGGEEFAIKEV